MPISSYLDHAAPHHMKARWRRMLKEPDTLAPLAPLADKVTVIARTGQLALSSGDSAWRVRDYLNRVAHVLGVTVHADISLVNIELTCIDGTATITEVVANASSGVNTERMMLLDHYVQEIEALGTEVSIDAFHEMLDVIEDQPVRYKPLTSALAAAAACASFTFLLGGALPQIVAAGLGAGMGQLTRRLLMDKKINQFAAVSAAVAASGVTYALILWLAQLMLGLSSGYQTGYIGAMLFVIPGFPLITSGFDLYMSEMRSGIERLAYALAIIACATAVGLLVAEVVQLHPGDLTGLSLSPVALTLLRALASFVGVYGFSVLFNSTPRMCQTAATIGMVANVCRLTLATFVLVPAEAAAFIGATVAGLLAAAVSLKRRLPRTAITVPSIVIMVPGLYMYRAVYYMGAAQAADAIDWLIRAALIVIFLPIGLIAARVLTDKRWRFAS